MKKIHATGALLALSIIIPSAPVQADLGNSIYVPVTPCRVGDTRQITPTTINAGAFVEWSAYGSDMSLQGGSASGCEQPKTGRNPIGAALNITAVGTGSVGPKGNLTAYPADESKPSASTLNYVQGTNLANSTIVGLCQDGSCDGKFKLESGVTDVPALVDVLGYFYPTSGNVADVALSGGDYTSPAAAIAGVADWCGTPSATNPCLVKIAPGVYDLSTSPLVIPAFVSVQGSGQNTTTLSGAVDAVNGLVRLEGDSPSLSDLTVANDAAAGSDSTGVTVGSADATNWTIQNVAATATNATATTVGLRIRGSACDGGAMINVKAAASGAAALSTGVESDCLTGAVTATNLTATASGTLAGGYVDTSATSLTTVTLRNSSFTAADFSILVDTSNVTVISSELDGTVSDNTSGNLNINCVGDYNGVGGALANGVFGAAGCI